MSKLGESVRSRLLENLRMLPHAPGVQMADIPEDSLDINQDELRDAANPDTRVTSIMKVGLEFFRIFYSVITYPHWFQCGSGSRSRVFMNKIYS